MAATISTTKHTTNQSQTIQAANATLSATAASLKGSSKRCPMTPGLATM
jgi:hypothetical protein